MTIALPAAGSYQWYVDLNQNPIDGIFKARTEELQGRIKRFDEQIEARQFRLGRYEENLVARFAALENLMGQLSSQQAYLGSQLA